MWAPQNSHDNESQKKTQKENMKYEKQWVNVCKKTQIWSADRRTQDHKRTAYAPHETKENKMAAPTNHAGCWEEGGLAAMGALKGRGNQHE